jgi:cell division transport system permease protein
VTEAAALEKEKAEDLLKPWLGEAVLDDLPIPHLVTVELDPKAPATAATLTDALAAAGVDATVDDHGRWLRDVEHAADIVRVSVGGLFVLLAAAAGAVIAFATRTGMAARRDVIEVLHLAGARDNFVAGLFQGRFAKLAFVSGFWGAAFAVGAVAALKSVGGGEGFSPALPIAWTDLLLISPCPFVAATVAAAAARLTTLRLLKGTR